MCHSGEPATEGESLVALVNPVGDPFADLLVVGVVRIEAIIVWWSPS